MADREIARFNLAARLAWLLRGRVRALVVNEDGLAVHRGTGIRKVAWSEVTSIIAGSGAVVSARGTTTEFHRLELRLRGQRSIRLRGQAARRCGAQLAELVVAHAGLVWVELQVDGRALPPMAVPPAVAANLPTAARRPR
jgi:hypothetical protein